MEFRVLGSFEVWADGRQLELTAAKQQALLVTGVLDANRVVSVARLVDAIWGDDPPNTAAALVQTYVHGLRRLLHQPDQPPVIATRPPGYLVRVEPGQLDLHTFERLLAEGRAAAAQGDDRAAAQALRAGLTLWRGRALEGLQTPVLRSESARLEHLRMSALEERISAELRLGQLAPLVAELTGLIAAHPWREGLRGQLMLALHGLSRQAEALDAYREARAVLSAELGIDPGAELQGLHQAILRGDPPQYRPVAEAGPSVQPGGTGALTVGPGGLIEGSGPELVPVRTIPSQLPPAIADLTGRQSEIAKLREALSSAPEADHPVLCAISGKAGSGKTALALSVAHLVRSTFPDGQLFARLQGGDPGSAAVPHDIVGAFLRALGVDAARLPEGVEERTALLRSLLAERRVLIVLDDAACEAQVRPLLPAHPGCAVLVTSRTALVGLDGRAAVPLDVLDAVDATALLGRIAGPDRVAAEPAAAAEIVALCGGLPLAVRIAGARLASRGQWPLSVLAARLRDGYRRLDELTAGDMGVRASLELSYRGVSEPERAAFRALGALGVPDFSPWLLGPLLDIGVADAERLADRLADAQLLDPAGVGADGEIRYRMHDLIRLYANERAAAEEPTDARREALTRVLSCLLVILEEVWARTASGAVRRRPLHDPEHLPAPSRPVPAPVNGDAWLEAERWTLVAAVERASELGLHGPACDLAALLSSSLRIHNRFDEWWRTHDAALAAARAAGDRRGEAALLFGLGQLRYEQDRFEDARVYFEAALSISAEIAEPYCEAGCLTALATVHSEQGRFAEALQLLPRAIAICREVDDSDTLAEAAYRVGYVHREVGQFAEALSASQEALELYTAAGNRRGEGLTLRSIGLVHRAVGALDEAQEAFERAVAVFCDTGDRLLQAYSLQSLAKVHIRQGRSVRARKPLAECLAICEGLGDSFGTALMLRTIGELHLAEGELDQALNYLTAATARWELLELPLFRARTQRDLAELHERRGDRDAAAAVRAMALETFREYGSREYDELSRAYGAAEPGSAFGADLRPAEPGPPSD